MSTAEMYDDADDCAGDGVFLFDQDAVVQATQMGFTDKNLIGRMTEDGSRPRQSSHASSSSSPRQRVHTVPHEPSIELSPDSAADDSFFASPTHGGAAARRRCSDDASPSQIFNSAAFWHGDGEEREAGPLAPSSPQFNKIVMRQQMAVGSLASPAKQTTLHASAAAAAAAAAAADAGDAPPSSVPHTPTHSPAVARRRVSGDCAMDDAIAHMTPIQRKYFAHQASSQMSASPASGQAPSEQHWRRRRSSFELLSFQEARHLLRKTSSDQGEERSTIIQALFGRVYTQSESSSSGSFALESTDDVSPPGVQATRSQPSLSPPTMSSSHGSPARRGVLRRVRSATTFPEHEADVAACQRRDYIRAVMLRRGTLEETLDNILCGIRMSLRPVSRRTRGAHRSENLAANLRSRLRQVKRKDVKPETETSADNFVAALRRKLRPVARRPSMRVASYDWNSVDAADEVPPHSPVAPAPAAAPAAATLTRPVAAGRLSPTARRTAPDAGSPASSRKPAFWSLPQSSEAIDVSKLKKTLRPTGAIVCDDPSPSTTARQELISLAQAPLTGSPATAGAEVEPSEVKRQLHPTGKAPCDEPLSSAHHSPGVARREFASFPRDFPSSLPPDDEAVDVAKLKIKLRPTQSTAASELRALNSPTQDGTFFPGVPSAKDEVLDVSKLKDNLRPTHSSVLCNDPAVDDISFESTCSTHIRRRVSEVSIGDNFAATLLGRLRPTTSTRDVTARTGSRPGSPALRSPNGSDMTEGEKFEAELRGKLSKRLSNVVVPNKDVNAPPGAEQD